MSDTMQAGDDPADFTVEQVQAHLASTDDDERARVLAAETGGKGRKGVTGYGQPDADSVDAPRPQTADAVVVTRPGSVNQAEADADADRRNTELEKAGVISKSGYIGSDGNDLR